MTSFFAKKWKQIIITALILIVLILILAWTGNSGIPGGGILGLIALSALIFSWKSIWKNSDDEKPSAGSSTQTGQTRQTSQNKQVHSEIDITSSSWDKVESSIFASHKNELLECCSPARFMEPYDHDKMELANRLTIKINAAKNFNDLKNIVVEIEALGIQPSSTQLYEHLRKISNPTNYIGKDNEFSVANDIYSQVLNAKDDITGLYYLLEETKTLYPEKSSQSSFQRNTASDLEVAVIVFILLLVASFIFLLAIECQGLYL